MLKQCRMISNQAKKPQAIALNAKNVSINSSKVVGWNTEVCKLYCRISSLPRAEQCNQWRAYSMWRFSEQWRTHSICRFYDQWRTHL